MMDKILQELHTSPSGGHLGAYRSYRRLAKNVYWPGMKSVVYKFVVECTVCQQQKYQTTSPVGLLKSFPIPQRISEDISMDCITGLPKSQLFDTIFVVLDRLFKATHFLPIHHPYSARSVAELFAKGVVRLHGIPLSTVHNRDHAFISRFWNELFRCRTHSYA